MTEVPEGDSKKTLRGQIAHGAGWMVLFRAVERSLGLISTIVLARLLIPSDFGIVAMSMSLIALVELLSAFNLSVVLIQRSDPPRSLFDTTWTLNLLMAVGCALLMWALAGPTALFFREPRLEAVILVLALGWVVAGAENTGIVYFRREMNFSREFKFMALRRSAAFIVTLALAVWWRNYWALVVGILTQRIAGLFLSFVMHPFRPRWSLQGCRELFSFSSWLLLNNFLDFLYLRLGHFMIGRVLGSGPLGFYTMGSDLANFVTQDFIAPINRAVFPGMSRMAERAAELKAGFLDVAGVIALLVFPAAVGMARVAEPLVLVALGERWLEAAPVVSIVAMAGILNGLSSHNHSAYLALGKPARTTIATAAGVVVLVPLTLILGNTFGLVGVAYALLAAVAADLLTSCILLFGSMQIAAYEYAARIIRPLIAALSMGVAVYLSASSELLESALPVIQLAVLVPLGVVTYAGAIALMWLLSGRPAGAEEMLWSCVRNKRLTASPVAESQPQP